ncbi:hypothetical protein E1218_22990 [Kribbella turkmenica]|uniref:Uncharacterized protein n=1 Tax=Kribbella turkmenica TaxID=2530375 RepID=A0A4R4WLN3_9ACTN|nr:hypothetical protein E1218_22990 [Kribbella turkmenica]
MAKGIAEKKRQPGNDEALPSRSVRMRVYAGVDPVTNTARYLPETVPPGPDQKREVERSRRCALSTTTERRAGDGHAAVGCVQ